MNLSLHYIAILIPEKQQSMVLRSRDAEPHALGLNNCSALTNRAVLDAFVGFRAPSL